MPVLREHARRVELRKQTEEKLNFVREDLRKILIDMIKAKSEEASFDNTLCEIVHTKQGPQRLPSKLDAAQQLAKICGYNEPDKPQEHNHLHLTVDSVNATLALSWKQGAQLSI